MIEMDQSDRMLRDKVDRAYGSYDYWRQLTETQAKIDNQKEAWRAAFRAIYAKNRHDPALDLYRFLEEAGAIRCPREIYELYTDLYISEHRYEDRPIYIRRDDGLYDDDRLLLLTQSTDYRFPDYHDAQGRIKEACFHVYALVGMDVDINPITMRVLGGRPHPVVDDKVCEFNRHPGASEQLNRVYWMRSRKPSISDQPEYYTGVISGDGTIQFYVTELSSRFN